MIWKNGSTSGVPECIASEVLALLLFLRAEAKTRTLS